MAASLRQRLLRVLCCGAPPRASSGGDPGHGGGAEAEEALLMEGWWFIIHNNQLLYKKRFKRDFTVLAEDLQRCSVQSCEDAGRRFCFRVVTPTRSCTFQADCEAGRRAWISAIQNLTEREEETVESEVLFTTLMLCFHTSTFPLHRDGSLEVLHAVPV
ncbi:arf-GAP with coiled-coil, ANK repeat and PH domain-containing protein 2-like [Trichomycterus rosablanca]|uniref:arf-GAP with coiled-coil, ANK repeat and PH domain-containing protein 2-like n=1 Tax=Trichomycterus rosablanca TaxID=2290929 RepID=UPI002F353E4D